MTGRALLSSFALALLASCAPAAASEGASPPFGGAVLEPTAFAALPGWEADDHGLALAAFRRTCAAILAGKPEVAPPATSGDDLRPACAAAAAAADPRAFFEAHFQPYRVRPALGAGFLTGYFEPEYPGSLASSPDCPTPLLARPDDLVSFAPGETAPGLDPALQAARRTGQGFEPYPDRAAIEEGALGDRAKPVVFLDPVDAHIVHVQGSARIRLPDGSTLRVAYAGKNGHPFTPVGRLIVQGGHIPLAEMNLGRMTAWLKANPAEARELMRGNRSYIFFRRADELAAADGPIGAAGHPLVAGRSLAVDRTIWRYGLPVWLEGRLPTPEGGDAPLARLVIAQDTGSAIVGPARGDLFTGTGAAAGTEAGLIRHPVAFVVLRPKPRP